MYDISPSELASLEKTAVWIKKDCLFEIYCPSLCAVKMIKE